MKAVFITGEAGGNGAAWASSRGVSAGWRQAWQQAQAAGWFCRADPLAASAQGTLAFAARGSSQLAAVQASTANAGTANPASAPTPRSAAHGLLPPPMRNDAPSAPDLPEGTRTVGLPSMGTPVPRAAAGDKAPPVAASRAAALRSAAPRPAFHIHLEREGSAVHAWLGLAAGGSADVALAALQQQLARGGLRLASLTCNGRLLFEASKET